MVTLETWATCLQCRGAANSKAPALGLVLFFFSRLVLDAHELSIQQQKEPGQSKS